jgi:tetratricopeptide (TPR) repeat protein
MSTYVSLNRGKLRFGSGRIELKEDFGEKVRRIMYSNSGSFLAFGAEGQPITEHSVVKVESKEWTRCKELAQKAVETGNYSQAETMWLRALYEANQFNARDSRLAFTLDNMASFYFSIGRFEQAEMFCTQALEQLKSIFGQSHIRVANCMNNLAGILYNQKRYKDAEPYCVRVLVTYEGIYGPDHADVGMAANNLAMLYHSIGEFERAAELYQRAIHIRTRALGVDDPVVITLYQNYANLASQITLATAKKNQVPHMVPLQLRVNGIPVTP